MKITNLIIRNNLILLFIFSPFFTIAQEDSLIRLKADSLYHYAENYANNSEHDASISMVERSMELYASIDAWNNYVYAKLLLVRNNIQVGRYDVAKSLNEEVAKMIESKDLLSDLYMNYHFFSGTINHELGAFDAAISDFDKAEVILKENRPLLILDENHPEDSLALYIRHAYLGYVYNYQAFPTLAIGQFERGLDLFRRGKHYFQLAGVVEEVVNSNINIGTVLLHKGDLDEAIYNFESVANIVREIPAAIPTLATAYNNLSNVYKVKGNYIKQQLYNDSLKVLFTKPEIENLLSKTGTSRSVAYESILAKEAFIFARLGQKEKAIKAASASFERAQNYKEDQEQVMALLIDIGNAFYYSSQKQEALSVFQYALSILDPTLDKTDYLTNPSAEDISIKIEALILFIYKVQTLMALSEKEVGAKKMQYVESALSTALLGVKIIENIQSSMVQASFDQMTTESSIYELEEKFIGLFDQSIEAAFDLYKLTNDEKYIDIAFLVSEKNKAFLLRQTLHKDEQFTGFPREEKEVLAQLEAQLFFVENQISKAKIQNDRTLVSSLIVEKITLREKYDELIKELKTNPETEKYYRDLYDTTTVTIPMIQAKLEKNSSKGILHIYEARNRIYTFFITAGGCESNVYNKPHTWNADVRQLKRLNKNTNLVFDKKLLQDYIRINKEIYDLIFADYLKSGNAQINRLVVIPHGESNYINFSVLLQSFDLPKFHKLKYLAQPIADFSDFDYLLHNYAISYGQSAAIWLEGEERASIPSGSVDYHLLGVAPEYIFNDGITSRGEEEIFDSLPYELDSVLHLFDKEKVKIISGQFATEEAFREAVEKYVVNILHISAHGEFEDEAALLSRIILSKNLNSNSYDGYLELTELYGLKMMVQLAILSACETGDGELRGGAGKINLARGFAYANCPSIIMSLWELEKEVNQDIIHELYAQLISQKLPIDQALQQAQLSYLKKRKEDWADSESLTIQEQKMLLKKMHPFYWAGLVPVGKMDALNID